MSYLEIFEILDAEDLEWVELDETGGLLDEVAVDDSSDVSVESDT